MKNIFVDRYGNLREGWQVVIALVVIALLVVGVVGGIDGANRMVCENKAELYTELDVRYISLSGCYIDAGEKWVKIADFERYYGDLHTLQIGDVGE